MRTELFSSLELFHLKLVLTPARKSKAFGEIIVAGRTSFTRQAAEL